MSPVREPAATVSGQAGRRADRDASPARCAGGRTARSELSAPDDPQDMFTETDRAGYGSGNRHRWVGRPEPATRVGDDLHAYNSRALPCSGCSKDMMGGDTGRRGSGVGWRRSRPRLIGNAPAAQADTIVLVA